MAEVDSIERAICSQRRLNAALIASYDRLSVPFTDRPELSPWTASIAPARRSLSDAVDALISELTVLRARDDMARAAGAAQPEETPQHG